jgi:hypothetical protein
MFRPIYTIEQDETTKVAFMMVRLVRFLVVQPNQQCLNLVFTANYFFSVDDVPINSERVYNDFVNLKIN